MSDRDAAVRLEATQSFAGLIRLMPLQCDDKADEHLPPRLLERHRQQRAFLDQLLDPKKVLTYSERSHVAQVVGRGLQPSNVCRRKDLALQGRALC